MPQDDNLILNEADAFNNKKKLCGFVKQKGTSYAIWESGNAQIMVPSSTSFFSQVKMGTTSETDVLGNDVIILCHEEGSFCIHLPKEKNRVL